MFPEGIRDVSCWPTFSTARKPHDPVGVRMRREGRACFEPRRTASRMVTKGDILARPPSSPSSAKGMLLVPEISSTSHSEGFEKFKVPWLC